MSLAKLAPFILSPQDVEVLVRDARTRLQAVTGVERVILFGSFAAGNQHNDSDMDFGVLINDAVNYRDTSVAARRVMSGFSWPTDIVVIPASEYAKRSSIGGVCFDIAEDGVELYPRWQYLGKGRKS